MRKIKLIIISLLLTFVVFTIPVVKADVFPKPNLSLKINYNKEHELEVDLLTKKEKYQDYEDYRYSEYQGISEEFFKYLKANSFSGYNSAIFNQGAPYFVKKTDNLNEFDISYHYPKTFKLIIYDTVSKEIYITNEVTQRAFNGKITLNLTSENSYDDFNIVIDDLKLKEEHHIKKGIVYLLLRVIITLVIEILILLLFMYRKSRTFNVVTITNIVTQLGLSLTLFLVYYFAGPFAFIVSVILGEILVITFEIISYLLFVKEGSKTKLITYVIVANLATILISFLLVG